MSMTESKTPGPLHAPAHRRIPVNIIAGPLGVGKTTTINRLLQQRPADEQWAVLVNEYGLIGLDAALMEGSDTPDGPAGVEIREVAGGCICCSAGFMFEVSLVLLLRRRPDRLLIEPTGLAALSGILDTLDREGIRESVDVRSVLCLLDPGRLDEAMRRDEVRDQVEAADVVLASRGDLATADQRRAFDAWAHELFPPKRFVGRVDHGEMPLALLDLVADRESVVRRAGHGHGIDPAHPPADGHHDHHDHTDGHGAHGHQGHGHAPHAHDLLDAGPSCSAARPIVRRTHEAPLASTIGWVCWAELSFDADRAASWLRELAERPGVRRTKAVLRTTRGWQGFNLVGGAEEVRPSGHRRDSRLELVLEGKQLPDAAALERELLECLSPPLTAA